MQELPFLLSALCLILIDICMKFCEDSLRGFQVTERTRFVTDRRTDGQTPREKQYVSQPFGGRHNDVNVGQPKNHPENGINEYISIFEVKKAVTEAKRNKASKWSRWNSCRCPEK